MSELVRTRNDIVVARAPHDTYFFITMPRNVQRVHPLTVHMRGAADHSCEAGERITEVVMAGGEMFSADWVVTEADWGVRWTVVTERYGWRGVSARVSYEFGEVPAGTRLTREMTVEFAAGHQECRAFRARISDASVQEQFLRNVKTALEQRSVALA
ncbi:hypothetical protein [Kribbella deserti]|uniref:Polyketide cyclase/dehydrase/lipid transport protein n=1 Tax=Kribbella deserti TaxID=1926257 RepID=A0ABV6QE29_9ACTN